MRIFPKSLFDSLNNSAPANTQLHGVADADGGIVLVTQQNLDLFLALCKFRKVNLEISQLDAIAALPMEPEVPSNGMVFSKSGRFLGDAATYVFRPEVEVVIMQGYLYTLPTSENDEPTGGLIEHKNYAGMAAMVLDALNANDLYTNRDLVDLGADGIDRLPIVGIGPKRSQRWYKTAVELCRAAEGHNAKKVGLQASAPYGEPLTKSQRLARLQSQQTRGKN